MTNINDLYNFINFVTDTYRNGKVSPEEFSQVMDTAQNLLFNHYIGERQKGNELAIQALLPFKKLFTGNTDINGFLIYPAISSVDFYAETDGIYTTINDEVVTVRKILFNELSDALKSRIYPIDTNPRFIEKDSGITVYPKKEMEIDWHYIRRPLTPVFAYTNTATSVTYNSGASVQLDFKPHYYNEIISLALPYFSVNLSKDEVGGLVDMFNLNKNNGSPD